MIKEFLSASQSVRQFLYSLGPNLFSPVISDIQGNINKINEYNDKNTDCITLGDLLRKEKQVYGNSLDIKEKVATDALLWLTRALDFVLLFLTLWIQDHQSSVKADDLTKYFQTAYEVCLKPYHSWLVQKVVNVMLSASPTRDDILKSFYKDHEVTEDQVFEELTVHVQLLRKNIDSVRQLFESVEYPWK